MHYSVLFALGSSPRIRGEWMVDVPPPWLVGIIPANTGRIPPHWGSSQQQRDHPREYGENRGGIFGLPEMRGSSPRIRGECNHVHIAMSGVGIIPANTGRISVIYCFFPSTSDHPREYGENLRSVIHHLLLRGSSPRIRGEYRALNAHRFKLRIIPANTGRINPQWLGQLGFRDHPREYGENRAYSKTSWRRSGSSPRIRGESSMIRLAWGTLGSSPRIRGESAQVAA